MPIDNIQQIKDKLPIAEFIRGYLKLIPAGKNFKANCPFHHEKTPSFIVSPDRGTWHCFGCNIGGDVFSFFMKYENAEFFEALKALAEKAGVTLERGGDGGERKLTVLYDINQAAADFFVRYLNDRNPHSDAARQYLAERGLQAVTIKTFEIGLAPPQSDSLTQFLGKKGYAIADIERAGLIFKTERGTYWDRFRGRIMFPIKNNFGKHVAFTGRLMPDADASNTGKYVNSPETPVFSKSKTLYGFSETKNAIREAGNAVLVEGQMDFLMTWQDGVKNVVATSGTAFTTEHAKTLERLTDTVILGFDADSAGEAASEKVIDLLSSLDMNVRVVLTGHQGAKDPADIVQAEPGKFAKLIAEAIPAMEYYIRKYYPMESKDHVAIKRGLRAILAKLAAVKSRVEIAGWLRELSRLTGLSERVLEEEMKQLPSRPSVPTFINSPSSPEVKKEKNITSRMEAMTERVILLALSNPSFQEMLVKEQHLLTEDQRAILSPPETLSEELKRQRELLLLKIDLESQTEAQRKAELIELIKEIKREYLRRKKASLEDMIRQAERTGDKEKLADLLKEFDEAVKEMHNV